MPRPSPHAARQSGVAMVFQHFSLFEALSVAENVALGMENPPPMQRPRRADHGRSARTMACRSIADRLVGDLSAGERQRVEIIRCLLQDPKLLIMDEPTSVLTPQEVAILFATLRKLSAEGTAILYISHKLEEIRALCEGATILRRGKVVATCTPARKVRARTGRDDGRRDLATPARKQVQRGEVAAGGENLSAPLAQSVRHGAEGRQFHRQRRRSTRHRRCCGQWSGRIARARCRAKSAQRRRRRVAGSRRRCGRQRTDRAPQSWVWSRRLKNAWATPQRPT